VRLQAGELFSAWRFGEFVTHDFWIFISKSGYNLLLLNVLRQLQPAFYSEIVAVENGSHSSGKRITSFFNSCDVFSNSKCFQHCDNKYNHGLLTT